jgi:hypothetical protein
MRNWFDKTIKRVFNPHYEVDELLKTEPIPQHNSSNSRDSIQLDEIDKEASHQLTQARNIFAPLKSYLLGNDNQLFDYNATLAAEAFLRFKNGAWNRQHLGPVLDVLVSYKYHEHPTAQEVLTDLQKKLLAEAKELNPQGQLAKCIEKIQYMANIEVININDLNQAIRKKKYKEELGEKDGYKDAIRILGEYYGHQRQVNLTPIARFFKGAWNRNNIDPVKRAVYTYQKGFSGNTAANPVHELLNFLQTKLLEEGKEINPQGELAKRIEEIQLKNDVTVINIKELNAQIKNKAEDAKEEQDSPLLV